MAIWKTDPTNSSVRNQNTPSPKHPGNPKWLTGTEWRQRRQASFIDMDTILHPSSRDFGLDSSGWGSVDQDTDGSGWGKSDQTDAGKGWGNSNADGSAGW